MSKFHSQDESVTQDTTEPLVQLWLLRLLIRLGAFRKHFCNNHSRYSDDELAFSLADIFAIDMEHYKTEDDDINYKEVLKRLDKLYVSAEKKIQPRHSPQVPGRQRPTPFSACRVVCDGLPHSGIRRSYPH